jgi:hypothetical protein
MPTGRRMPASEGFSINTRISDTTGGVFDEALPSPTTDSAGTGEMTIQFADCESRLVSDAFPSLGTSGDIPITRPTLDNVARCQGLAGQ